MKRIDSPPKELAGRITAERAASSHAGLGGHGRHRFQAQSANVADGSSLASFSGGMIRAAPPPVPSTSGENGARQFGKHAITGQASPRREDWR